MRFLIGLKIDGSLISGPLGDVLEDVVQDAVGLLARGHPGAPALPREAEGSGGLDDPVGSVLRVPEKIDGCTFSTVRRRSH